MGERMEVSFGDTRLPERFWKKVRVSASGCWDWTGGKHTDGYGVLGVKGKHWYAHRFAYWHLVGEIPPGLTCDHLCRNRSCANPSHIEIVSNAENIRRGESPAARNLRKTHCVHGHAFSDENTYWRSDGTGRMCRACTRARVNRLQAQSRERRRENRRADGE